MSTKLLLPLLNRNTQDRGTKIDNLDATISSRAPASTALSNVTWTNTRAGYLDNLDATISSRSTLTADQVWSYGTKNVTATTIPSVIQSVQRGTTTLTNNGTLTTNVTISAVDLNKSFVQIISNLGSFSDLPSIFIMAELTSTTNLQLSREDNDADVTVVWQVIEFV
jgi:hypothetical protein